MKNWKKSKGVRSFLYWVLFVAVFLDVLGGMYLTIGREYAGAEGEKGRDFYISQERTSQILDGYIRLFEEYMQIGNLITVDGDIDYDKEILVSLTDDKKYTIKELLQGSPSEGVGSGKLRDFMADFAGNCEKGISYPWKSRFILTCDSKVIIEGDRIFSFVSPNAKSRSPKQVEQMQRRLDNMYATSTDDVTYEDDFRDEITVPFTGELSWEYRFHAKSVYEEYVITHYPSYARCYILERMLDSYGEQGKDAFLAMVQLYNEENPEGQLSEKRFYQYLKKEYTRRKEMLSASEIPWRVHSVPRTMREAKKYVSFLVETYQELKFLFSRSNFLYAYESSRNLVMSNHGEDWQKIKLKLNAKEELERATDQSEFTFIYFSSPDYDGRGNFPRDTLPMSGNIVEKIRNIGKSYSTDSYQIAVGINLRDVMRADKEDEFVQIHQEMMEKGRLYLLGSYLAGTGMVLTLISFFLLCLRCGRPVQEGQEREPLYWYDRIWLEAQLILFYLMGCMLFWIWEIWNGILIHPLILLCALSATLVLYGCLRILLSVVKRGKLRCGIRYSVIFVFFREVVGKKIPFRTFVKNIGYHMAFIPPKRKFGFLLLAEFAFIVYFLLSACYVLFDSRVTIRSYMISPLGIIGAVSVLIFLVILFVWQRSVMYDQITEYQIISAMKQIIGGDFSYQLSERDTMGLRVRELVRAVNQIGDVVEAAVEESVRSERMKTELIANVSHDIKTPLTSIINYVDLLQGEEIQNEKVLRYIGILDKKSQRLKVLMEDLIEASKASSGVMELEITPLDFSELVRQANGEFEERFAESHLELVSEIPGESLMFQGDGRRVFRILENLYNNTAKYAMEHTRVYVILERLEGKLVFTIKNVSAMKLNITPEELTERFVRGDHARTTEGSGLGLSIAKSLTELMGGEFLIDLDGDLFCGKISFPEMTEG